MHENTIIFIEALKEVFSTLSIIVVNEDETNLKIAIENRGNRIAEMTLSSYDDVEVEHIEVLEKFRGLGIFSKILKCLEDSYYGVQFNIVCNATIYNILSGKGYKENIDGVMEFDGVSYRFMNISSTITFEDLSAYPHAEPDFKYVDMYKIGS